MRNVTDEKRLYTGNADGMNTQIPNADDLSAHTSNKENPHGVYGEQVVQMRKVQPRNL